MMCKPDSLKHAIDRDDSTGRVRTSEIHSDAVHWAHGVSASSVDEFRLKKKRRSSENKRVRQEQRVLFSAPVNYDVCSTKSKAK